MTTETCSICQNPLGDGAQRLIVHDVTLELCFECSDWGYLHAAANPANSREWAMDRIRGAMNAAVWRGRAPAGVRAPDEPAAGRDPS
jgi:hypothetical protein